METLLSLPMLSLIMMIMRSYALYRQGESESVRDQSDRQSDLSANKSDYICII